MKRVFAAVLVAAACVVGSTPGFARGGLGHVGGLRTMAALCAILPLSWDHQHHRYPLSKTGFRPRSRRLRNRPSSTARRREAPMAELCSRLSPARWRCARRGDRGELLGGLRRAIVDAS